ncbi:MAG TPA: hypothetical protein VHY84_02755 [Bryobacteraceae bacterium]|jgi:CheY-like chemotaxis protein|nr:hypothetical protein [Bryobacteraceae bacterium]
MPRVRIVHWKPEQAGTLIEACRACGFEVEYEDVRGNVIMKQIRANPPDAIVIDLTCRPSHGREVAVYLRNTKYARHIPLIFVDGEPEKVEIVRRLLPDAVFTARRRVCAAVKSACAKPVAAPARPPGIMERYGSRTVAQKLGIKEGSTVAVIDAPRDYVAALGELPANVEIVEDPYSPQSVTLWFVRDARAYQAAMRGMRTIAAQSKLWVVWRKGVPGGLTDRLVRAAAVDAGLVDYKICALNEQWSAMAFARRKS